MVILLDAINKILNYNNKKDPIKFRITIYETSKDVIIGKCWNSVLSYWEFFIKEKNSPTIIYDSEEEFFRMLICIDGLYKYDNVTPIITDNSITYLCVSTELTKHTNEGNI